MSVSLKPTAYAIQHLTAAEVRAHSECMEEMLLKLRLKAFMAERGLVMIPGRRVGKTALQNALQAQNDRGPAWLPPAWPKMPQKG